MRQFKIMSIIGLYFFLIHQRTLTQNLPNNGVCHSAIEQEIDELVAAFFRNYPTAGMTISASIDGKIILSKGYGYADVKSKIQMQPYHRSWIGSVSKVITSQAVMKLIEERDDISLESSLYSDILASDPGFKIAYNRSIQRFNPIIAMSMDDENRVYTWYVNKMYSIGTPTDLDHYQELRPFTCGNYDVQDIIAIAMNEGTVHTWFNDRKVCLGTGSNLVQFKHETRVETPEIETDRSYYLGDILGITFDDDGQVLTFYDDGRMSTGSIFNLGKFGTLENFSDPQNASRYDIRGIARGNSHEIYFWFNGKVSSGNKYNLDQYSLLSNYSYPSGMNNTGLGYPGQLEMGVKYESVQLKHLLTHTTGYKWPKSGEAYAVEKMFGNMDSPWPPEGSALQHKYYLTKRKAIHKPGTVSSYSNNLMGFNSYIIYHKTGIPYGQYVNNKLFVPLNLDRKFVNQRSERDQYESTAYYLDHGKLKRNTSDNYNAKRTLSNVNASGGWSAAAESLIQLLLGSDGFENHPDIFSRETVNLMDDISHVSARKPIGWDNANRSHQGTKLSSGYFFDKNGSLPNGGSAWLWKFNHEARTPYLNLSNINIAICKNSDNHGEHLEDLGNDIADVIARKRNDLNETFDLYTEISNRKTNPGGIVLFRPSTVEWRFDYNLDGETDFKIPSWGRSSDIPLTGDFGGTGQVGIAVFRPDERKWFIRFNYSGSDGKRTIEDYGKQGDIPITGDFDGNGKCDIGLFRPSTKEWRFDYNLDGHSEKTIEWGRSTDIPITGDFGGIGQDGIAIFRPDEGKWFIRFNYSGSAGKRTIEGYGKPGDIPISGDFNQDGKCDIGFFRPSTKEWRLDYDMDGHSDHVISWGESTDIPIGM